jgi:hypothetical protein
LSSFCVCFLTQTSPLCYMCVCVCVCVCVLTVTRVIILLMLMWHTNRIRQVF